MQQGSETPAHRTLQIVMVVVPGFNIAATFGFLDPFRAANYLAGRALFRWALASPVAGMVRASNGATLETTGLPTDAPDLAILSSSWQPEAYFGHPLDACLRRWSRFGTALIGLDTGAFGLADAGLLDGRRATVHYEHTDAFAETFPTVIASEDLYVIDGDRMTCCGGQAATDLSLQILRGVLGDAAANAAARYIFHENLRPECTRQLPESSEPLGKRAPDSLRRAIQTMEDHLEEALPIPQIAAQTGLSQRQLERLFHQFVGRSPRRYYTDIRLDRARGLVTQTELPLREIALACGFASAEHFSRAYRHRFGLTARRDRVEGRVPFEFRAWPMQDRTDVA
ncbi:MAG: GlxA family transcriptional regulator [Pseudomonadota bacterium]